MAELSAEERYNKANTKAFDAYIEADSEYQKYINTHNSCVENINHIIDFYNHINDEITENAKTWSEAQEKTESLINVVVIGVMNHGKSTMLNALLNNTDNSLFKVADRRETRKIQHEERENICWTDTPGFAADEDDDNKALAGIKQLEVGFFVHKASVGELHANEVEVLHKIAKNRKETFLKNTCIVLNDDISNDEQLEKVFKKISEQLDKFLDVSIPIFVCNPKSYQKGLRENKKILAGESGIAELRSWIEWRCEQLRELKDSRIDQTSRILEPEIRRKCKIAIEKLEEGIQDIEQQISLARTCSDNLHKAIKKIGSNKDRMRGLKNEVISDEKVGGGLLGGGGGAAVGAALGSIVPFFGTLAGAAIGAALGSTAGVVSSDFEEKHNFNIELHNDHIEELNGKKNDIAESIRDFKRWQDELKELSQNMQEFYEIWK